MTILPRHSSSNGNSSWRESVGAEDRGRRLLGRALERRLARPCATSCSISEPLTLGSNEQAIGAFQIFDAERRAVVVAKIELCGIAMQVSLADVEVAAVDPALENREVIFGSVGVPEEG